MDEIPDESRVEWRDVISRTTQHDFDNLGLQILLGRLNVRVKFATTASVMEQSVRELRTFFQKSSNMPSVRSDLAKIFGREVA